jgi:hypothetical protein
MAVAAAVWHAAHLELLISAHHRQSVEAFYLAESGWNRYFAERADGTVPIGQLLVFPQGSVRVEISRLAVTSPDTAIYVMTATGHRVDPSGRPVARRSVRLLAIRDGAGRLVPWRGTWREVW